MDVIVKGRYFSKEKRLLLIDFTHWASNKLLGHRLSKNMSVVIHITGPDLFEVNGYYGLTDIDGDDDWNRPRNFIIKMTSKYGILRSLMIVAHEMVHVKQQARLELSYCGRTGNPKWQGTPVSEDKTDYWDLPWEIEAHGREKGLVYQWAREKGHNESAWLKEVF